MIFLMNLMMILMSRTLIKILNNQYKQHHQKPQILNKINIVMIIKISIKLNKSKIIIKSINDSEMIN